MRVLDRMERDLVVGAGDEPEGDTVDDSAWLDDIVVGLVGVACNAVTTGLGGGALCTFVTAGTKTAVTNSPSMDLGAAYSCAKIGTDCDAVSGD